MQEYFIKKAIEKLSKMTPQEAYNYGRQFYNLYKFLNGAKNNDVVLKNFLSQNGINEKNFYKFVTIENMNKIYNSLNNDDEKKQMNKILSSIQNLNFKQPINSVESGEPIESGESGEPIESGESSESIESGGGRLKKRKSRKSRKSKKRKSRKSKKSKKSRKSRKSKKSKRN
jgi:hypothetical protein